MNAVLGTIVENLKGINIVAEPTTDVFKGDRTNTGDSKEITVKDFISSYLPSDFHVKKGKIYSLNSDSNNIDCVVLAPNHPKLRTPLREVILAEGVFAAVEVKPDISVLTDKSELFRGLQQIRSIKKLDRKSELSLLDKLSNSLDQTSNNNRIPSVLFSFRSANIRETINFISEKLRNGILEPYEIPDLIVTLDKGIIFFTPNFTTHPLSKLFDNLPEQKMLLGETVFIHFETPRTELTLVLFLAIFLSFRPPTILTSNFIIKEYLGQIEGEFKRNVYPVYLLLKETAKDITECIKDLIDNPEKIKQGDQEQIRAIKNIIQNPKVKEVIGNEIYELTMQLFNDNAVK